MSARTSIAILGLLVVGALGTGRVAANDAASVAAPVSAKPLDRAALSLRIDASRAKVPAAFAAVARVRAELPRLDAQKRGTLPVVTPRLSALGKDALLPMLERLVLDPDGDFTAASSISASARRAWRAGLLEAIGALREPSARDALAAFLDDGDPLVVRAAAEAIGKIGDDDSVRLLLPRIAAAGPTQASIVSGVGACRRASIAKAVASLLATRPEQAVAKAAARALGDVGSSWAWATKKVPAVAEEHEVRAVAAAALVELFVSSKGEVRQAASNALMVVDDPSTPARIEAAKAGASIDTVAALDALAARFAKNPVR